jgi:hypothetical protein
MHEAFNRMFWKGALSAIAMSSALLVGIAVFTSGNNPPKPAIPIWGHTYLSAYRTGHFDHYLFRFGLFGFGDRIRNADVLILGSSHAMFGISAEAISTALSERQGRTVTAFNLATGAGEGMGFAREILEANKTQAQTLLLDLYSNERGLPSEVAQKALRANILGAYIAVAAPTTEFVRDWLFDGFLPRINFGLGASLRVDRFLQPVITRRRDNGDLDDVWTPEQGSLFQDPPAKLISSLPTDSPQLRGAHPTLLPEYGAYLVSKDLSVVLTLIPYDGYRLDEAKRVAEEIGRPFLPVEPKDLQSLDGGHLTAASRTVATRRLIDRWSDPAAR